MNPIHPEVQEVYFLEMPSCNQRDPRNHFHRNWVGHIPAEWIFGANQNMYQYIPHLK